MSLELVYTGRIIKEYLDEYSITQKELHFRIGISEKHISNVLNGNSRLTEDFALKLEKVIPTIPASYWLNYESKYRENLARNEEKYQISTLNLKEIAKRFHFKEVFKGIDLSETEKAIEMLKLLKIGSYNAFDSIYNNLSVDFMEDGGEVEAIAVWINLCEREIDIQNNLNTEYKRENVKKNLDKFKILATNKNPELSVKSCRKLCNQLGINLVVLPALNNCKVRGALTSYRNNPTIYLSGRFKTHDNVWFAFMHEIGHLLLHYDARDLRITYENYESLGKEDEANCFARDFFINPKEYNEFIIRNDYSEESIRLFAKRQSVLPGIVVARLQHDKIIDYSYLAYLK